MSDLHEVLATLSGAAQHSRSILDAIGDGISIQDREFRILYQNSPHRALMGDHVGSYCYHSYAGNDGLCRECPLKITFVERRARTVERSAIVGGKPRHFEITVSPLTDSAGEVVAGIQVVREISRRKSMEERLLFLSTHDPLTGLYNRARFDQELIEVEQGAEFPVSFVVADVDELKQVNDTCGHDAGDQLLVMASAIFRSIFRADDLVARIGGDEFAVILPDFGEDAAKEVVHRVRSAIKADNELLDVPVGLSIGMATAHDAADVRDALVRADRRMYDDKIARTGRPPRHPCLKEIRVNTPPRV